MIDWFKKLRYFFLLPFIAASCGQEAPESVKVAEGSLPPVMDYNFHVRPILSDNCFACHGPDAENRKAGLRLDLADEARKALSEGRGRAIVPGSPEKSQAYARIVSQDEEYIMPPPDSHLKLSPREMAIIKKWIEQGAVYKPHWAFVPPAPGDLPEVEDPSWAKQPIDYYVLDKLGRHDLSPSEAASKETLIRRVTFDLTGLPPTLEEVEDFVNDKTPDAYAKVVDRLLASQAYGERMAADWMDVARYADSDGYLDDKHREFYPWRDWVIEAFNRNMPYDQFITWQIAGDLMPGASKESTLATAFNRLHRKNSEAGIVFEEYRVEYVADRTNTVGKGILGLSMECARCHDHKYDPISQKDYYRLFGFFNSTFEIGTPVYGPGQVPGPSLLLSTPEEDEEIDKIRAMIAGLEDGVREKRGAINDGFQSWLTALTETSTIEKNIEGSVTAHYPFDELTPAGKAREFLSDNQKDKQLPAHLVEPIHKEGARGKALFCERLQSHQVG